MEFERRIQTEKGHFPSAKPTYQNRTNMLPRFLWPIGLKANSIRPLLVSHKETSEACLLGISNESGTCGIPDKAVNTLLWQGEQCHNGPQY